jgi:hypothetical protein
MLGCHLILAAGYNKFATNRRALNGATGNRWICERIKSNGKQRKASVITLAPTCSRKDSLDQKRNYDSLPLTDEITWIKQ